MAISLKTPSQIEQMRQAGRVVREALDRCAAACKVGATTAQIDAEAEKVLAETGAVGLFKWYPTYRKGEGFPACTCISVNEEVVHGIPGPREIRDGDVVSIDFGCRINGWCGDSATTVLVGNVDAVTRRLCEVTEHVLAVAIENVRPGRRWSQVARLM
jgi:methionyl aminopeptidase